MSIKSRLQLLMKMNNLSNAAFADKIGVQRSSISHVIAGRNRPSLDFLEKTLKAFPRVDAHWLITGEQSKLKPQHDIVDTEVEATPASTAADTHTEDVKEHDEKATAKGNQTIERIVVFYADGTYEETLPKK